MKNNEKTMKNNEKNNEKTMKISENLIIVDYLKQLR